MPTAVLDRLPLPNLQVYVVLSILLMSSSIYYAFQMTSEMDVKGNSTTAMQNVGVNGDVIEESATNRHRNRVTGILLYVLEEPLCIWTLINMAFCCLILIVRLIQRMVFGELRVSEQQHVKDKFWNFVFYKFIFIFGVMNVQFMDEVILWCGWFAVLGFLHLLAQLSKDRFEYLSFSPTTPKWTHIRLLTLLVGILGLSSALYVICILVGVHAGINTFAFMAAECVLLNVQTLYVIIRYAIHLYDLNLEGTWENRGTYIYYTELVFELTALIIDFCHHLHMLVWGNIFLSMASLVICMQLRCLLREIQRRVKKHKNFLRVVRHLEKNFPMATVEELRSNSDDCAICWDKMETARKLPCAHFFHNSCLRSWLEQDTSCPTCRTSLTYHDDNVVSNVGDEGPDTPTRQQDRPTTNHFFHFDGSRYVSWLPSFSVEVTHVQLLHGRQQPMQTSQLDSMAHQVQQLFPHIAMAAISDDLRVTRSVEQTIENVLDGRLLPSPFQANRSLSIQPNEPVQEQTGSAETESQVHGRATSLLEMPAGAPSSNDTEASDNSDVEEPERMQSSGGRFSKSPRERETMLAGRKQDLIKCAKRRYLARRCSERRPGNLDPEEEGSAVNRRYRSYEAARKRLFSQHDVT